MINVLGLVLGICSCLIVFLIVSYEFSFDRFHSDKEYIYRLISKVQENNGETHFHDNIPTPATKAIREQITGCKTVTQFIQYAAKISIPHVDKKTETFDNKLTSGSQLYSTIIADPQYFTVLEYQWLAGNAATSMNRSFCIVMTESKARKYFGDIPFEKVLGKQVIYNDSLLLQVSGIVRDWDKNTDFPFTEFISFSTIENSFLKTDIRLNQWGNENVESSSDAFVKLYPNISPEKISEEFTVLANKNMKIDSGTKYSISLQPLSDIHFNSKINDNIRKAHLPTLYILMGFALFSLLIAAINFINLSTAQFMHRNKEIGLRKVLGSTRVNLVLQFLIETLVTTFCAVCIAVLMVRPVLSAFHAFIPDAIHLQLLDPSVLLFIFMITLATTLLAGLYPAKVLSSYSPVLSIKGKGIEIGGQNWYLRRVLIVFQFTISLIFIIATLVISSQINFIRNKDLGFNSDAIVAIDTDWSDSIHNVKVFEEKIRQLPGVKSATLQSFAPMSFISTNSIVQYEGKNQIQLPVVLQVADEDFIPLYQMKLSAGNNFIHSNNVVEYIINETASKGLGFANPADAIGKYIHFVGGKAHPITGVVADFHEKSFHEPIRPVLFMNFVDGERSIAIKLITRGKQVGDVKFTLAQIETHWNLMYPGKPFKYNFLDESIGSFYDKERKTAILMNTAMAITIFISCMGLFGLSMFTARQKTKEIGIRKVLGASVLNIVTMLNKDFIMLVGIAILIASPIAWYFMNQWLQDFVYRINISWLIFVLAGLGSIFIALVTVSFQSIKAALANPVEGLRTE